MSMLAAFVQLEPALAARLNDEPELLEELFATSLGAGIDPDVMRALMTERAPQGEAGEALLALLEEHLRPPAGSELSGKRRSLSLDKAWHGVHYLLTGAVEPDGTLLGQAVLGGTEVGEDFTGYGPARLFEPDVVAALAAALAEPCVQEEANGRYDPARMAELQIYPFGWDADGLAWLLSSLRGLRAFYAEAAAEGLAVATCLE